MTDQNIALSGLFACAGLIAVCGAWIFGDKAKQRRYDKEHGTYRPSWRKRRRVRREHRRTKGYWW